MLLLECLGVGWGVIYMKWNFESGLCLMNNFIDAISDLLD